MGTGRWRLAKFAALGAVLAASVSLGLVLAMRGAVAGFELVAAGILFVLPGAALAGSALGASLRPEQRTSRGQGHQGDPP